MPNNLQSSPTRPPRSRPGARLLPLLLAAAVGGVALGPTAAHGQASAAIPMVATVGTPVTVTGDAPLDFTQVFSGTPKTVDPVAGGALGATAGRFSLVGKNNSEVLLMFTVPSSLTSGANTLPIDSWQGCHSQTSTTLGCTAFVPSAGGTVARLSNGGGAGLKSLYIWVGATVHPTPLQPGGAYTAALSLTTVYTGF
jgi:hypothetical protein